MNKALKGKKVSTAAKKRMGRSISSGVVHIRAAFTNTIITFTDQLGNAKCWSSSGKARYMGTKFKGKKKATLLAAVTAGMEVGGEVLSLGVSAAAVRIKGHGPGRDGAVKGLKAAGLTISEIRDVTPLQHNGCRPPKR